MYVTKDGRTQRIDDDTYSYWRSLGWQRDDDRDGIPDVVVLRDESGAPWMLGVGTHGHLKTEGSQTQVHRTGSDFAAGSTEPQPRLRVNRTSKLDLTSSWQRVDFNGSSARNGNSFPLVAPGTPKVLWDATGKRLRFMEDQDRNYDVQFSLRTLSGSLIGSVLGMLAVKVQFRFVVPAPTPVYFPLPDVADPYADLHTVNLTNAGQESYGQPIYANSEIRQYGLGIDLRLSGMLGGVTLEAADLIVYGR